MCTLARPVAQELFPNVAIQRSSSLMLGFHSTRRRRRRRWFRGEYSIPIQGRKYFCSYGTKQLVNLFPDPGAMVQSHCFSFSGQMLLTALKRGRKENICAKNWLPNWVRARFQEQLGTCRSSWRQFLLESGRGGAVGVVAEGRELEGKGSVVTGV